MPSANPEAKASTLPVGKDNINDPMKPAITIVEHKIRNLEKRKAKLDQYKSEQDQGKELNADQLAAVAKYGEVTQQLEFARDLIKQFNQASEETRRQIRKDQKKEQAEKAIADMERLKTLFVIQAVMADFDNPEVWSAFFNQPPAPGTIPIEIEDNTRLSALPWLKPAPLKRSDVDFERNLENFVNEWTLLLDGSKKDVPTGNSNWSRKSYRKFKEFLLRLSECDYFKNLGKVTTNDVSVEIEEQSDDNESVPQSVPDVNPTEPEPVADVPIQVVADFTECKEVSFVNFKESTYSFLQESQIDLESPHMDPAVVAVSSFPPSISQPTEVQRSIYTNSAVSTQDASNSISMQGIKDELSKIRTPTLMEEEITEWDASVMTGDSGANANNKNNRHETGDYGGHSNRFGSSGHRERGGFRGRTRGRGSGNYANGYSGSSRGGPRAQSREYNEKYTERIGFYKPDGGDNDYENKEFRSRGTGGGRGGGFRGGNAQGNNFNNSRGNGSGGGGYYRGGPRYNHHNGGGNRGKPAPARNNDDNGITAECY